MAHGQLDQGGEMVGSWTAPVGLAGELTRTAFVRDVTAAATRPACSRKPSAPLVAT